MLDGPPYANGDPHLGHALNKVLKDIVNRCQQLKGKKIYYYPGWDCHGLPIELKALKSLPKGSELNVDTISETARNCAAGEVEKQMNEFRSWAVMGDWDNRYETMSKEYEMGQLKGFADMVKQGNIYQGVKPVWWSPVSRTALAQAELEYNEKHVSTSVWVAFSFAEVKCEALRDLPSLKAVAWTTTAWTIPSNRALIVNSELDYCVAKAQDGTSYFLAHELVDKFSEEVLEGEKLTVFKVVKGSDVVGSVVLNPLTHHRSPILSGDYVTTKEGSGVVHAAPGHGNDDYLVCGQHGILPFSPVDDLGRFNEEVGIDSLVGLDVLKDGTAKVIELMKEQQCLLKVAKYVHKYPYDWRSKTPVIVRSTRQWFLRSQNLKQQASKVLENVRFFPENGKAKMMGIVSNRMEDWCISRQRFWGVPIPAFYHKESGKALMDESTIQAFIDLMRVRNAGSKVWWDASVKELLPEGKKDEHEMWEKGTDTMDVWMDSGLAWTTMKHKERCDLVIEGTDQYRGWFQSLLLTWIAAGRQGAPFDAVGVHGFCLDSNGVKMSKSEGNVIPPSALIFGAKSLKGEPKGFEGNGVDVLRMWIASHEFGKDISVSRSSVDAITQHYRKIRNTLRWILGCLDDFDPNQPLEHLGYLSQHLMYLVKNSREAIEKDFDDLNFANSLHRVAEFISAFSSIHVESMKDSLYCNEKNDPTRRSNQRALLDALHFFLFSLKPIIPHTMQDVIQNAPKLLDLSKIMAPPSVTSPPLAWDVLQNLRNATNQLLESARNDKAIGSPLDASVELSIPKSEKDVLQALEMLGLETHCFFGSVSKVNITEQPSKVFKYSEKIDSCVVSIEVMKSEKCPRCWIRGDFEQELCPRCARVMKSF